LDKEDAAAAAAAAQTLQRDGDDVADDVFTNGAPATSAARTTCVIVLAARDAATLSRIFKVFEVYPNVLRILRLGGGHNCSSTAVRPHIGPFDNLRYDRRCHVHFHSIEVARFLFARWRVWAHWTRAIGVTRLVPFCLVVVQASRREGDATVGFCLLWLHCSLKASGLRHCDLNE